MKQKELKTYLRLILDPKLSIAIDSDSLGIEYRVKKIAEFINEYFIPKEIYPHAFGCEKFDDGKCDCGYEN